MQILCIYHVNRCYPVFVKKVMRKKYLYLFAKSQFFFTNIFHTTLIECVNAEL